MSTKAYLDLKKKQQEEISAFPIAYAFNEKQLEEALEKLGATKEECVSIFGHGDVVKKTNAKAFIHMLERHVDELKEKLRTDEAFAEAAFRYEMDNHEYAINWDGDEEILNCFNISETWLQQYGLEDAYRRARNAHMKQAEKWGLI